MPQRPPNTGNVRSVELGASHIDHTHTHAATTGKTANDHHNEDHAARHAENGADELDAGALGSGASADGTVLTSDGVGGSAWEAASGHGGHVTNGDSHDHVGGDGAQVDHGGLAGLADDDHTSYLTESRHAGVHSNGRWHRITTDQTGVVDSTDTTIVFNGEIFQNDPDDDISFNTSTGVMTINTSGVYQFTANVRWATSFASATTLRILFRKNGAGAYGAQRMPNVTGTGFELNIATLINMTATDTMEVVVSQTSGSDADIAAHEATNFTVSRVT